MREGVTEAVEFSTEAAFWLGVGYILGYLTNKAVRHLRWSINDSKTFKVENWQLRRIKDDKGMQ